MEEDATGVWTHSLLAGIIRLRRSDLQEVPNHACFAMIRLTLLLMQIPLALWVLPSFAAEPPRPKAKVPEFAEMLGAILINGSKMGPTSGWFHPSESRYRWSWLADRFDLNKDGVLTADELKG